MDTEGIRMTTGPGDIYSGVVPFLDPTKTYFMKEVGPHQYKFDPDPTEEQRLLEYANKLMERVFRFR